jgi:hypothetical protein
LFAVTSDEAERSGVLVLRVWLEGDPDGGLRARILGSSSGGLADQPVSAAATTEGVTSAVRSWLEGFTVSGRMDFWELITEPETTPNSPGDDHVTSS